MYYYYIYQIFNVAKFPLPFGRRGFLKIPIDALWGTWIKTDIFIDIKQKQYQNIHFIFIIFRALKFKKKK